MTDLENRLQKLAYKKTNPFCYQCYKSAPTGRCETCGSDDLMRELSGNGVEYGTDWVIKDILAAELTPVDLEEALAESIREIYGKTTKVGWMELDTVDILKEYKTDWRCALADEESRLIDDDLIYSPDNGSNYYWVHDIEKLLSDADIEE